MRCRKSLLGPNLGDQGTMVVLKNSPSCKLCKHLSSFPNGPFGSIWVVHEIHRNPLRSPHSHIIQLLPPCQMFGNFITPKRHTTPSATIPIPHTLRTSLYIFVHLCMISFVTGLQHAIKNVVAGRIQVVPSCSASKSWPEAPARFASPEPGPRLPSCPLRFLRLA